MEGRVNKILPKHYIWVFAFARKTKRTRLSSLWFLQRSQLRSKHIKVAQVMWRSQQESHRVLYQRRKNSTLTKNKSNNRKKMWKTRLTATTYKSLRLHTINVSKVHRQKDLSPWELYMREPSSFTKSWLKRRSKTRGTVASRVLITNNTQRQPISGSPFWLRP